MRTADAPETYSMFCTCSRGAAVRD